MRIIVERKKSGLEFGAFLLIALLAMSSGYAFAVLKMSEVAIALGSSAILAALVTAALGKFSPLLVIDDQGVFDARLGVGKIAWSDIEDVQIERSYGNRFLCFRLRRNDAYVARLSGAKRQQVLFHQKLGFKRFNVDVQGVEVNLLDLKQEIDRLIKRHHR